MLTGAHRFPRQDQVTYGRPATEAVRELATGWGARRILVTTTRSLADGLAAQFASALGDLCVGVFPELGAHSPVKACSGACRRPPGSMRTCWWPWAAVR